MQAYVDDSTGSGAVMVLAGYVATVPQWLDLTQRWERALAMEPPLRVFKMNKLKQEHNRERVEYFYRIIEETVAAGFYIAIPIEAHAKVCAEFRVAARYRSPYYMAWILLISVFRKLHTHTAGHPPLDLIFDNQKEEQFVTKAWHILKARQKGDVAPFRSTPVFKDDEDVLPLQAADLLAWWARKSWIKHKGFDGEWLFPWEKRSNLVYAYSEMDEDKIRKHFTAATISSVEPLTLEV